MPWIDYRLVNTAENTPSKTLSSIFSRSSSSLSEGKIVSEDRSICNLSPDPTESIVALEEQNMDSDKVTEKQPVEGDNPKPKICTDKNFLSTYFKNSRLHHLSEWRNKFKEKLLSEITISPCEPVGDDSILFHVDMDCFFASVATRFHPELQGIPVGISHSNNPRGSADIAACNYEARKYGVRNGMWVKTAVRLCPDIQIVGYEFNRYEQISKILFKVITKYSKKLEILSCDEAFVDVSGQGDPNKIAKELRQEIYNQTGCSASIGIGCNRLLARIATKKAKPDGQFYIDFKSCQIHLAPLSVRELPGIGSKFEKKLNLHNIVTVGDILKYSLSWLKNEFGDKSGETLYNFARGLDSRNHTEPQKRKSIGVECNWGVRLNSIDEAFQFLLDLTSELHTRLNESQVVIGSICFKIRVRFKILLFTI